MVIASMASAETTDYPNPLVEAALSERPAAIIELYRKRTNIDPARPVTVEMIRKHYYTARAGAGLIINSTKEDRQKVTENVYDSFYKACFWLDDWKMSSAHDNRTFSYFSKLLRGFGDHVYEIGSGTGALSEYLSSHGFRCIATEISSERKTKADSDSLVWHTTDGIHLARYEPENSFDILISSQLIEHLHPEDIEEHCANALRLLKAGGIYIFDTPNRLSGPADFSEAFGLEESDGLHLKEYTHGELSRILYQAGFSKVKAVYVAPKAVRSLIDICFSSSVYLVFIVQLENMLTKFPSRVRRKILRILHVLAIWRPNVFLLAIKGEIVPNVACEPGL
jgi:SAM-dependent methyltransferase